MMIEVTRRAVRGRGGWAARPALARSAMVALAAFLTSCGGDAPASRTVVEPPPGPPPPLVVGSLVVRLTDSSIFVGEAVTATAEVRSTTGVVLTDRTVTWTVQPAGAVATVSSAGRVTSVGAGKVDVAATADGLTGLAPLTVLDRVSPTRVAVSLPAAVVAIGDTLRAVATVYNSIDQVLPNAVVRWSTLNPTLVSVDSAGLVTAIATGRATIVATADSVSANVSLQVASANQVARVALNLPTTTLLVGDTVRGTAVAFNASNEVIVGATPVWSVAGAAGVISVSQGGVVTALSAGNARVVVSIDGIRDSTSVSVTSSPGTNIVLPEEPREILDFPYPAAPRRTTIVRPSDNLQSVLNAAQRGDEIVLQAGGRWTGNFVLPAKAGTVADGWIILRGDSLASLPPLGTRVLPAHGAVMPKLVTVNANSVLATAPRASGWRVVGVEMTVDPAFTSQHNGLVLLGDGTSQQNSLAVVPTDLVLDRVYIHGAVNTNLKRCVALNSARTAITDSYLYDCHGKGFDSQAICMWNGPGPFKIVNNTLAGAGENILIGGSDPAIRDLIPSDIEIRRNFLVTPASWKGVWTKKNLLETKNAQRLLIEGNIFDGSWTDGQVGVGIVFKSANQSGRCTWCASRDIVVRYNIIRNMAQSLALTGREGGNPYAVGERLNRVLVEHNVFENIHVPPYLGDPRLFLLVNNGSNLTVRRNTWNANPANILTFITFGTAPAATNFAFESNITTMGKYGMLGQNVPEGAAAWNASVSGIARFTGNVLYGPTRNGYPAGTVQLASLAEALGRSAIGADRPLLTSFVRLVVEQ